MQELIAKVELKISTGFKGIDEKFSPLEENTFDWPQVFLSHEKKMKY